MTGSLDKRLKGITRAIKRVIGTYPARGDVPLTEAEFSRLYQPVESFTNYLPWLDYDPHTKTFEFDDGVSVGALFDIVPVDVDGRTPDVLEQLEENLTRALHVLPQHDTSPWILQFYLQDEPILPQEFVARLRAYARPEARETEHAKAWFKILEEHFEQLRHKRGIFTDPLLNSPWRGVDRKIRMCFYRRCRRQDYLSNKGNPLPGVMTPAEELETAVTPFVRILEQTGMRVRRCNGEDLYRWMLPWLSPSPTGYDDPYEYLRDRPYPDEETKAVAFDLGHAVTTESPRTVPNNAREKNGTVFFCNQPQRFISLQAIDSPPKTGVLTADKRVGKETKPSLWDQMPHGSIFTITIVVRSKLSIDEHINRLLKRTGSASYEQDYAREQAEQAQQAMARGKRMYSVYAGVFVRSEDEDGLLRDTLDAMTVLRTAGLNPTDPKDDPIAKDCFLKNLPMAYDYRFDQQYAARSRLTYTHHIARLLPLYGRGRGTGNPGFLMFNRVGETFEVDPYNKRDRKKTAHGLIFGPTGAGKSAFITYSSLHSMAMRLPRQFFIEKGGSFALLELWYRRHGFSTNKVTFDTKTDISMPPYARMKEALRQVVEADTSPDPVTVTQDVEEVLEEALGQDYEDDQRDYLGEMEMMSQLMITGAEEKEFERMTRQDRMAIQTAIIEALKQADSDGKPHPLITDVCAQLHKLSAEDELESRKQRLREMADSLALWTRGLRGHFFNRYGTAWPEVDATFIDMGILTQEQNKDMLAVMLISLLNAITGIGEKYQYDSRETEVTTDEGHIITANPVLVKPFVFGVKTWRKLGIWLNQATQNLDDYPDQAKTMLNLAEWWYCLVMPQEEIEHIARFKSLTEEEKKLMLSATKEPGLFTEGVIMSDTITSLFRVVMPGLPLALAQTDQNEKAARREIAEKLGFTGPFADLDAAIEIGNQITAGRNR